jgi:hypothetical protein
MHKALSGKPIQTATGLRQIKRWCRSRDGTDALIPADLNRPGTPENRKAQEHQNNRKPIKDVFQLRSRDESNMLEITQPFRVNRTGSLTIFETKPRGNQCTRPISDQAQEHKNITTSRTRKKKKKKEQTPGCYSATI